MSTQTKQVKNLREEDLPMLISYALEQKESSKELITRENLTKTDLEDVLVDATGISSENAKQLIERYESGDLNLELAGTDKKSKKNTFNGIENHLTKENLCYAFGTGILALGSWLMAPIGIAILSLPYFSGCHADNKFESAVNIAMKEQNENIKETKLKVALSQYVTDLSKNVNTITPGVVYYNTIKSKGIDIKDAGKILKEIALNGQHWPTSQNLENAAIMYVNAIAEKKVDTEAAIACLKHAYQFRVSHSNCYSDNPFGCTESHSDDLVNKAMQFL